MRLRRLRIPVLILISLAFILSACGGGGPAGEPPAQESESPQAEEGVDLAEGASVDIEDIEIQSLNTFRNSFNEWIVCGYLYNIGDATVGNIRLEFEFLDDSGLTIQEVTMYEALHGLVPGEKTPFHLYSMETLPGLADTRVTITSLQAMEKDPAEVLVQGASMQRFQSGVLQIVGEIVNPNEISIIIPELKAAINDSDGAILAAEECDICTRYLEPGGVGPFRVVIYGLPAEVTASSDFKIYPFAQLGPALEEIDLDWSLDQITFTDPLHWYHLVGELENQSEYSINLHLLGTLYDAEGKVLDVTGRELIPHMIPPGTRTGYELKFWGPHTTEGETEPPTTWSVQVDRYRSRSTEVETIELSTIDVNVTYTPGKAEFTGKILNDSGTPVATSTVLVMLRDLASGQIVGMGGVDHIGPIGEEGVEFHIPVFIPPGMDQASLSYTLHVSGY
jgi:hypothetical protein